MIRVAIASAALLFAGAGVRAEEITFGALKSSTPASWKAGESNKLRIHTFNVPKSEGDAEDAEIAVFFFGPGSGGGVAENLKRWKGMFEPPAGKSIDDVAKVETIKIAGDKAELTYLDLTGTYLSKFPPFAPNAKVTKKPDYRMLAIVFDTEGGPYFVRLTGPARTVEATKADFDKWLKNFQ
jgi:hypothetical protein